LAPCVCLPVARIIVLRARPRLVCFRSKEAALCTGIAYDEMGHECAVCKESLAVRTCCIGCADLTSRRSTHISSAFDSICTSDFITLCFAFPILIAKRIAETLIVTGIPTIRETKSVRTTAPVTRLIPCWARVPVTAEVSPQGESAAFAALLSEPLVLQGSRTARARGNN